MCYLISIIIIKLEQDFTKALIKANQGLRKAYKTLNKLNIPIEYKSKF